MRKTKRKRHTPLTDNQKKAAFLLFDGKRTAEIAEACGIHRATLWRWRNRPDFQREINRITDEWLKAKRRETMREIRSSPEYKARQQRKCAARRKLKRLGEKMSNAKSASEFRKLQAEFDKQYNTAYFDGMTPAEYIEMCHRKAPIFRSNKAEG